MRRSAATPATAAAESANRDDAIRTTIPMDGGDGERQGPQDPVRRASPNGCSDRSHEPVAAPCRQPGRGGRCLEARRRVASSMMSVLRHWAGRVSIGLWTLWLAAVMAVPGVLRVCPLHDGLPGATAAADSSEAQHADHARHPSCHGVAVGARHERGPDHDGRPCHCLGDCSAGTAAALPSVDPVLAVGAFATPREAELPAPRVAPPAPARVLPFANGPPAALG